MYLKYIFICIVLVAFKASAQDIESLELLDTTDADILLENNSGSQQDLDLSELEEIDDLESLKKDIGDFDLDESTPSAADETASGKRKQIELDLKAERKKNPTIDRSKDGSSGEIVTNSGPDIYEIGDEEKKLVELSKFVESKIPENEWQEIAGDSKLDKYVVQEGDWLWKIAQQLFGSGFYYSKIWSLNPQITNPHEIEPGMVLVFNSGDSDQLPEVKLGVFEDNPLQADDVRAQKKFFDFKDFGDNTKPEWIDERANLKRKGTFFQYISEETYDDLVSIGKNQLVTEYRNYEPPATDISIEEPGENYDEDGFDKNSRITFNIKEGYFLNTFLTTNIVQDLGEIVASDSERTFLQKYERIYLDFDESVKVKPGDKFSVYLPEGKVKHQISDRSGFRYTIAAQVRAIKKINDKWEAEVFEISGLVRRGSRLTVYTPKIAKISQTFNRRNIEAALIGSFRPTAGGLSFGDVVYLDRGRADGVEMGNVFEIYNFFDPATGRRITRDPTYKIGEVTVITLSDNFATALITNSIDAIDQGMIALSKTAEKAVLASRVKSKTSLDEVQLLESGALEELDIELNLDDISEDLLEKADRIQLTEDELEELERQEREKSVIKDQERDLQELERLEQEIIEAEAQLNEAKVDEDKFLEQQSLERIEKSVNAPDPNAFESLDEIEEEFGRKYLDEDLNAKDNPYGLTEYDLEEIDLLLNTDSE